MVLLSSAASFAAPDSLPAPVATALDRAKVPREAVVAVVQEVGTVRPRLTWQAEQPVNPASLMKLLTTYAALELLGPAWTWSTPVWLHLLNELEEMSPLGQLCCLSIIYKFEKESGTIH